MIKIVDGQVRVMSNTRRLARFRRRRALIAAARDAWSLWPAVLGAVLGAVLAIVLVWVLFVVLSVTQ